jgi:hypothetical protein
VGCNTLLHGNNARNLSVSLPHASKNAISFYYSYIFSSTKLEKRAKQLLPRSKGGGGRGQGVEMAQAMYAHINK